MLMFKSLRRFCTKNQISNYIKTNIAQKNKKEERIEVFKNPADKTDLEARVMARIEIGEKTLSEKSNLFLVEKKPLTDVLKQNRISTKNQTKLMIEEEFLKVRGQGLMIRESEKVPIDSTIKMNKKKKEHYPIDNVRLFLFFKPKGVISEEKDRTKMGRFSCHEFIRRKWDMTQTLYSNTRLDFNCEGLMLFTDSVEMDQVLAKNQDRYEYVFMVKVQGNFTEEKFRKIRQGAIVKGKQIGPFYCNVKKRLKTNTVLEFKTNVPRNREIKLILQKNDLRMGKCVLEKYGPFSKGQLKQGDFTEVLIPPSLKRFYYDHKSEKIDQANKLLNCKVLKKSIL